MMPVESLLPCRVSGSGDRETAVTPEHTDAFPNMTGMSRVSSGLLHLMPIALGNDSGEGVCPRVAALLPAMVQ